MLIQKLKDTWEKKRTIMYGILISVAIKFLTFWIGCMKMLIFICKENTLNIKY